MAAMSPSVATAPPTVLRSSASVARMFLGVMFLVVVV